MVTMIKTQEGQFQSTWIIPVKSIKLPLSPWDQVFDFPEMVARVAYIGQDRTRLARVEKMEGFWGEAFWQQAEIYMEYEGFRVTQASFAKTILDMAAFVAEELNRNPWIQEFQVVTESDWPFSEHRIVSMEVSIDGEEVREMNKKQAEDIALQKIESMIWDKISGEDLDTEFGEDAVKVRSAMQAILVEMNEKIVKLNKKAKSD